MVFALRKQVLVVGRVGSNLCESLQSSPIVDLGRFNLFWEHKWSNVQ